jgi:hypothetical protein
LRRLDDLVGDVGAPDTAEGAGEPSCDHRMTALKEAAQDFGGVADAGKRDLGFDRIPAEEGLAHLEQCCRRRINAQAVANCDVLRRRHLRLAEIIEGRVEEQLDRVVGAFGTEDEHLRGNDGVLGVNE